MEASVSALCDVAWLNSVDCCCEAPSRTVSLPRLPSDDCPSCMFPGAEEGSDTAVDAWLACEATTVSPGCENMVGGDSILGEAPSFDVDMATLASHLQRCVKQSVSSGSAPSKDASECGRERARWGLYNCEREGGLGHVCSPDLPAPQPLCMHGLLYLTMASKRKGDGQRGDSQQNRKRWKQQPQKEQLSGPGILLTTVRRKERKAGLELIEFLNDLVPKLYPDLNLSVPVPADEWDGTVAREAHNGDGDGEDDDWDALRNGQPSVQAASSSPAMRPKGGKPTSSGEDDLEAKIQAELAELRPQKKTRGGVARESGVRERFRLVDPEVECLMFVAVAWPMDPVELSCALLDEVARTGQVRGRFIQRLSPIYGTSRAEKDKLEALARTIVAKHFSKSPDSQTVSVGHA